MQTKLPKNYYENFGGNPIQSLKILVNRISTATNFERTPNQFITFKFEHKKEFREILKFFELTYIYFQLISDSLRSDAKKSR